LLVVNPVFFSELLELAEGKVTNPNLLVDNLFFAGVCHSLCFFLQSLSGGVILLGSLRDELVVLRNVPLESIVNLDFVQLHHSDVLEGRHVVVDISVVTFLFGVVRPFVREASDSRQNNVYQFDVETRGQESAEHFSFDAVLGLVQDIAEPFANCLLDEELVERIKKSDGDHHKPS
jgi:hypothetical protein